MKNLFLFMFMSFSIATSASTDTMYFSQRSMYFYFSYKNLLHVSMLRNGTDTLNVTLIIKNISNKPIGLPYQIDKFEFDDNEGNVCIGCSGDAHGATYKYRTYVLYQNECDTISISYKKMKKYRLSILFCPDINKMLPAIPTTEITKDSVGRITYFTCISNMTRFLPQSRIYIENINNASKQSRIKVFYWHLE